MDKDLEAGLPSGPADDDKDPSTEKVENHSSLHAVDPVNVHVRNLSVDIDVSPGGLAALSNVFKRRQTPSTKLYKNILHDVSANMPSGSLTAVLGGSGSGKTTMLHALSHRISGGRLQIKGKILYNEDPQLSNIRNAYVMQNDVLLPTLTVRETLLYAAELRLPPPTTSAERQQVVEDVILELGLKECADTRIGNDIHKGCSGGEKRRTSLGVQMLANPSVLFLDEVTTGLDAASAFQLVRTLKLLANKGRTIIVTIHQPRSEIWSLFDGLVLLSGGAAVYSGSREDCLPYFEGLGFPLPAFVNPAEFLVDLAAIDNRSVDLEQESTARVEALRQPWRKANDNRASWIVEKTGDEPAAINVDNAKGQRLGYLGRQIRVLTARTLKTTYRDPMGMSGSLIEALTMAIITGWIFLNLDGSLAGIRSRQGALYTASALQGYLILIFETYRLTIDIELFDREYAEGVTNVSSFLISRRLARLLVEDLPVPLLYSVIFYFMVGFDAQADQFLVFFAINLLLHYIAVNLAMLCVSVSRDFAGASLIGNMAYTIQSLGSGYFVQSNQIPVWVRWIKYTAYVFYGFGALAANEFVGHTSNPAGTIYDCPAPGGASDPACEEYTGAYVMRSLGFPSNWIWRPIMALVGFVLAFYLGAGIILRYKTVGMGISRARPTEVDNSLGKEDLTAQSLDERLRVTVSLENYSLDIEKREWTLKKSMKSILKPFNTVFEPGVLNVIMGPSGSGKTSLLNLMADRLDDSLATSYKTTGNMKFNNTIPSAEVVKSMCSYVCQDDDALLARLTVRENLHFAAGLRLPTHLSKIEKRQRAESVLLKLGLKDCADNLVGDHLVKGISGGEKRRVTIAIQILTDPRILLLDEPTSGLDAFTASSIMTVLKGLAEEGRTLILTIHQARSDLFTHFGNILLLARGGSPVFAGKGSSMLPHFASLGFHCPTDTNPADFALDLITVNLQHATLEASTREKVRSLIHDWNNQSNEPDLPTSSAQLPAPTALRTPTPTLTALPLLLRRSALNFRRSPPALIARTTQVLGFAALLTLFFAPLRTDTYSIQTRLGFIQEFQALYFVGMLQNVAVYPAERAVFRREHADAAYNPLAFFLAYTALEIPFEILTALLFACLTVLAAGLPRTPALFFTVAANCFAIVSCGESLGIVFNTLFAAHTGFAVNVTSTLLSLATIMGGVVSLDLPPFLQAWNHLSPVKWSLGNLAPWTLRGVRFGCPDDGGCGGLRTGEEVLRLYGLDGDPGLNLVGLGVCVLVYRVVAWGVLEGRVRRGGWGWVVMMKKEKKK
ncbi:MAG: hypothetical protein LQ344_007459 [Seirophora lacunosa]|nr:MAG: hypothetical protein LQ344_007459 [Seirophora lacunosa]